MQNLITGANIALPAPENEFILTFSGDPLDCSVYLLASATGKTRGDADMLFYGQTSAERGAVTLDLAAGRSILRLNTAKISPDIGKIALCVTVDGGKSFAAVQQLHLDIISAGQKIADIDDKPAARLEKALIVAEIYRYKEQWKCRCVLQGFHGGLKPLAEHFGMEILDDTPPPAEKTPPAPQPQRITLDKQRPRVQLAKKTNGFPNIKINLNWNKRPAKKSFFRASPAAIDLDLGAMVRLKDDSIDLVQALGNHFGNLNDAPYSQLEGDDRTGAVADGEWLSINGEKWKEIKQVVIFCFIYEGVANWAETDGVVRILIPSYDEIVIPLTEGDNTLPMCGVVSLRNDHNDIAVERVVKYFHGHKALDDYFRFGFHWISGRK